ncbi:helix-turn-helix transcriptional regulator [Halostagnicola bangensis]
MVGKGLRALACVLVVTGFLLVVGPSAVATPDATTAQSPTIQEEGNEELTLDDADTINIEMQLQPNGNATVSVDYRYLIGNNTETEQQWDTLSADVDENAETYIGEESDRWQDTLEEGENETNREMNLSSFTVETDESTTPREYGHIKFTFEWESFAYVELNRIEAGDALAGFMFDDDTELQMSWPETHNATAVDPEPDTLNDNWVLWDGDSAGSDSHPPQVELIEEGAATNEPTPDDGTTGVLPVDGLVATLVLVTVAAVAAVAGWLFRRDGDAPAVDPDEPPESTDSAVAGSGQVTMPPPELLSNEERVLRLLEERGGRLKQQQVVSELEWTEAKTSQVVSGLREDGEVDVFRIGRENVLTLPEAGEDNDSATEATE